MAEEDKEIVEFTKTELANTELLTLLQNFSNLRTGQDQVLWSIIGAFWTANSLLLVSIFATDKLERLYIVGLIISLVGISISWVWNQIQESALNRIERYEKSIITIERKLCIEYELCAFLRSDSDNYEKFINKKSARFVMRKFSKYAIYIWTTAAILFAGLIVYNLTF